MAIFQTKISRARLVYSPFSSEQMAQIGEIVMQSVRDRIHRGETVEDTAAKPLKPGREVNGHRLRGYPDYKIARGLQPIRDWTWTGRTMRALRVLTANENAVKIGFSDPVADYRAHINNRREKAFGISPKDKKVLNAAVLATLRQVRVIQFKKAA
jgi:hypothetical protein